MSQNVGSNIVLDGLTLSLESKDINSYRAPIIAGVQIYSVYNGGLRSSNYTVQYSDDNSTWTTAFTGVMSNNTSCGIIRSNSSSPVTYGAHRYWRYVEGSAVISHHPRCSRIDFIDINGRVLNLVTYTSDNCSDSGTYLVGTVSADFGGSTWYNTSVSSPNTSLPAANTFSNGFMMYNNNYSTIGTVGGGQYETTMECWFYVPSGGSYTGCCETIFGKYWFRTFLIGQSLYTMIGFANPDGSYNTYQHPAYTISYDGWHHAIGMRRNDRYIIWIDGTEMYNGSFGSGLQLYDPSGTWYISASSHPNIKVASARVYNRGLSDNDILQNYKATKTRFGL